MKSSVTFRILILVTTILLTGCISAGSTSKDQKERIGSSIEVTNPNVGLDQYLKRLAGVRVYGSGLHAKILIRGTSSLELSNEPLFVMDDVRLGRDFNQIYKLVDMTVVNKLKALNSTKATLYYGQDGYAGVIEISTQN